MTVPLEVTGYGLHVVLNVPVFGDSDQIEHHRINRETRAGEKIIYRDAKWPVTETLKFKFEDLSQIQVKNILLFINKTLAKTITLKDQNNVSWTGIIVDPDTEATQDTRTESDLCGGFSFEFSFEGKRV